MISEIVTDIERKAGHSHLLIPGGWRAHILEVEAQQNDAEWLMSALESTFGLNTEQAVEAALRLVQNRFSFGYTHGLRMSVLGYAIRYLKLFPEMRQEIGGGKTIPRGFKPEVMQRYYLPAIGVRVEGGVDHVLQEMRDEAMEG